MRVALSICHTVAQQMFRHNFYVFVTRHRETLGREYYTLCCGVIEDPEANETLELECFVS